MNRHLVSPCTASGVRAVLLAVAFALSAGSALADYNDAIMLFKRQKYRDALRKIQPDVTKNPDWEFGHRFVGLCYFNLKEYDAAVRAFERASELKSTEPSTYLGLAESYYQIGQMEKAVDALDRHKTLFTKRGDLYNFHRIRAFASFRQGRFYDSADAVVQSFQYAQGSTQDWLILGLSYFRTNQDDKARQALNTVLQLDRDNATAKEYLARLRLREGETALKNKNYPVARDIFAAQLKGSPGDAASAYNLALAQIGLKDWPAALTALDAAGGAMGNQFRYHYFRGFVSENMGKLPEAEASYQRALQIEDNAQAREALQRVQRRKGRK
jgi:tetratricopeptide (TPR) repeat protein